MKAKIEGMHEKNALEAVRIFVSSPGDVAEERTLTRCVIERLRAEFAGRATIEPIYWEREPLRGTDSWHEQEAAEFERRILAVRNDNATAES